MYTIKYAYYTDIEDYKLYIHYFGGGLMTNTATKIFLVLLVAIFAATCIAFTVTSIGSGNGADYINHTNAGFDSAYNGKYTISVMSAGNLPLSGIRVSAKKNGATVMTGISQDGKIEMSIPADEYELTIDESTLPEGYYVPENANFKTTVESGIAKIELPSRVISTTATSGTVYNLGDVMHDFSFTEPSGTRYTLSEVLSTKKAVVINLWYVSCVPCQSEFPAIQKAYQAYGDKVDIIALSPYDNAQEISIFQQERGLTFHMAPDQAGLTSLFSVGAFPTTIIIDRYGVVAYRYTSAETSESVWKALFNKYTADDYTQEGNDSENPGDYTERVKPNGSLHMPSSEQIENAILDNSAKEKVHSFHEELNENDAPYSWPWLIGEKDGLSYVYASNASTDFSYATMYCTVTLNASDVLSYYYNIVSESGNDVLYVLINGNIVAEHSGDSSGWVRQYGVYVADRTITLELAFIYIKDQKMSMSNEFVGIRNIVVSDIFDSDATAVDQRTAVTDGLTLSSNKKYDVKLIAPNTDGNDTKYYKIEYTDNSGKTATSLLYVDILNSTLWAEKRGLGSRFVSGESSNQPTSLYHLSYWQMSNYTNAVEQGLKFEYGYSNLIIENYYMQGFSDNGLIPITEELKTALIAFTKYYCQKNNVEYYEDQWLELCYLFKHFGETIGNGEKHVDGTACNAVANPVKGLSFNHAYVIEGAGTEITRDVDITKILSHNGGGMWYSFTPMTTGVYCIYSTRTAAQQCNPAISVEDKNGNEIAFGDNDLTYNSAFASTADDFRIYVVLHAGEEYRVHAMMSYAQSTGSYKLHIRNVGQSFNHLRVASTGGGSWLNLNKYNGIEVAFNKNGTGFYHAVQNHDYGEVIYIDFVHPNYYDQKDNSLYQMVTGGLFNFTKRGGSDYTQEMLNYYYKSLEGKESTDQLYGLTEADERLVYILNQLIYYTYGNGPDAFAWLMFACYYVRYSV